MALAVASPPHLSRADRYRKVIESLVIRDEEGCLVPMRFSDSQALLWEHVAPSLNERRKCWQIILKARQIYACLDPRTRVLTADLSWIPLEQIGPGQHLVTLDESDPHGRGNSRKMRVGEAQAVRETYLPAFRLVLENGESVIATAEHRFLTHRTGRTRWRSVSTLKVGHVLRTITRPWGESTHDDGWLGGLLDGEGSLTFSKGTKGARIAISQCPGPVLDRAISYLKQHGYTFGVREATSRNQFGSRPVFQVVISQMNEVFRLIGQSRPSRFIGCAWWDGKALPGKRTGYGWSAIVAKIPLGAQRMLDLQTTTGTFVAEGIVSHNSTLYCGLSFVRCMEAPNTHALVIAQDLDTSTDLFGKITLAYDHLPLPKLGKPTKRELKIPLPGGLSRYRVISAGIEAKGRGTTQTILHGSEVAHWPHPEILTGILQAMPDLWNTMLVLESTANGMRGIGQWFYDEWMRAVAGESDLEPIFIPWFVMPKYRKQPAIPNGEWDDDERLLVDLCGIDGEQLAWRRFAINTKLQGSADRFNQEYPSTPELAFIFTGDPAFDHRAIYKQRENIRDPLARGSLPEARQTAWVDDPKGAVRIWEWPRSGAQYVIGADTAEGILGGDYACAEIFDMRSMEQVAAIHGYIPPWDFAKLLNDVGRLYNNAVLAIEINNTGHAVQDPLIRVYFYPNLHRWRGKPDQIKWGHARLFGWETNTYSRPLMIDAGRRAVNTGLVTLREEKLLDELKHFSRNDFGKYEAEAGHDDRVIALLIALRSREENYFPARVNLQGVSEDVALNSQLSVRVVDQAEPDRLGRHRFSRLLRERVKQATEQCDPRKWMTL